MKKYQVTLIDSKQQFTVEQHQDLISAAKSENINIPYGCCSGECGACIAKLSDGEVSYQSGYQAKILTQQQKDEGYIVCCMANAQSDITLRPQLSNRVAPTPQILDLSVIEIELLNETVYQLTLKPTNNTQVNFIPGQFINILLDGGQKRSYSISHNVRQNNTLTLQIKVQPEGLFSDQICRQLKANDKIKAELPLGNFFWQPKRVKPVILAATGTGLAPIHAILEELLESKNCPSISLYWGCKQQSDLYYHKQLLKLTKTHSVFNYKPVLSQPAQNWQGLTGHIYQALVKDHPQLDDHQIYLAGSPEMIKKSQQIISAYGANPDFVFTDSFQPAQGSNKKGIFSSLLTRFTKKKQFA